MTIVCAAKTCKYSSDVVDSSRVIFINFPNDDTSKIWAHHCGRTDLLMKSNEELHLNYYICSHHIEDRYYISKSNPIIIQENAIPTLFGMDNADEKNTTNIFNRNETDDSVTLSYCDIDVEADQYQDISIRFSNLCRICGESTANGIEIFAGKGIELKLQDKIGMHTPIKVDIEDLMPQKLCMDCYSKLEIMHSLIVTCLRTDIRLRRFLNIDGEPDYDNRYSAIVEECSLEVAQEMCVNETTQTMRLDLPAEKVEKIGVSTELVTELSDVGNNNTQNNDFASTERNEIHCQFSSFMECYNEMARKDSDCAIKVASSSQENQEAQENRDITCLHCKDTFKTQEIFENHKMLCDEGEVLLVEKQKEIAMTNAFEESKETEIIQFQFAPKTCEVCNKNFESEELLDEHKFLHCKPFRHRHSQTTQQLVNNGEKFNFKKDQCNVSSNVPLEFNKRCGHCETVYPTKKQLLNHINECHEGQLLLKCFACDKAYEKWSGLDVHEATHRVDKPYLCDLCGKSFKHSNNLRGHKRTHLDESKKKRHVCEICGNAFRSRFHLREHMNQHDGNKPYSCEQCGKAFYKRIQLRQHKLSHGLNRHACPICGATFNRRGNMNTHLKRHNNGDGTYTCSVCTCRCKSMSELKLHRKMHTEQDIIESIKKKCPDKTIWECKICNRIFSKRAVLLNHERVHRGEKLSVECDVCGKTLASRSSLIYHKKSMHSKERPHMCQYCGDSFVSKEARLIHERIHTGERPYVCKICSMQYKCSSNLNQHMKIHSGIRPHKCAYCNKSFTRKGALSVHERIHTGVKPFPCEICGRTFSQKNDMLKHTKTHDVKSLRCEQCDEIFTRKKDILKHVAQHEQNSTIIQEYVEVQPQMQPYTVRIASSDIE